MFGNKSCCIQKLFCIIKHCCSQNMFCVLERLFAGYNLFKLFSFKLFIAHASCMLLLSAPHTGGCFMLAGIVLIAVYIWAMHVHHWWCCWWLPHTLLLPVFPQAGFHCWCTSVFGGQYSWYWPIDNSWDTIKGVKYNKHSCDTYSELMYNIMYVCMHVCHHV